jgi:hypothetical protein
MEMINRAGDAQVRGHANFVAALAQLDDCERSPLDRPQRVSFWHQVPIRAGSSSSLTSAPPCQRTLHVNFDSRSDSCALV